MSGEEHDAIPESATGPRSAGASINGAGAVRAAVPPQPSPLPGSPRRPSDFSRDPGSPAVDSGVEPHEPQSPGRTPSPVPFEPKPCTGGCGYVYATQAEWCALPAPAAGPLMDDGYEICSLRNCTKLKRDRHGNFVACNSTLAVVVARRDWLCPACCHPLADGHDHAEHLADGLGWPTEVDAFSDAHADQVEADEGEPDPYEQEAAEGIANGNWRCIDCEDNEATDYGLCAECSERKQGAA